MYTNKSTLFPVLCGQIALKYIQGEFGVNIHKENALANTRLVKMSWISFSPNNVASSANMHQFNL